MHAHRPSFVSGSTHLGTVWVRHPAREHTDDLEAPGIEVDDATEDVWIRREAALPELVRDDDQAFAAPSVGSRVGAPQSWRDPERGEEVHRRSGDENLFGCLTP